MTINGALWRKFGAVQIYGANTDVGKTIFSTLLCNGQNWSFLKPVSTGPRHTADDMLVSFGQRKYTRNLTNLSDM